MDLSSATPARVRILLVDDHPLVRKGLASVISSQADLQVVGEAGAATEAMRLIETERPDLVVIDLTLEDGHGLDLIRQSRQSFPGVRLLAVSMHDEALFAERVLQSGGQGYVHKARAADEIITAIRQILAGQTYLSPELAEQMGRKPRHGSSSVEAQQLPSTVGQLSNRELAVFEMIGQGWTTRQIADRLSLSHKTVETHRERIKRKLHLENGPALVKRAVEWIVQSRAGAESTRPAENVT